MCYRSKAMRLLYAVQFEVGSLDAAASVDLGVDVLNAIASWVCDWYSTRKGMDIEFPLGGGTSSPAYNHELSVRHEASQDGAVAHSLVSWSYPDDNDGNLFWHSRCEVGQFNGLTEFSIQLSLDSTQFLIAPVEFNLKRPRLVGTLLRQFRCSYGDVRLSLEPRELTAESVESFVKTRLLSPKRRLPIVLVSRTPISGKWLVDPSELADPLAGIAETYCLSDKWAAFALSDEVGKLYSCYNGAVRLYWPDFDPAESPYSPVYTPNKLDTLGGKLVDILFRQLSAISAFRYVTGPVTTDAWESLQEQKHRELDAMRRAAKERGDYQELFNLACQENTELRKGFDKLREENESLRASLQLAQQNFRAICEAQGTMEAPLPPEAAEEEAEAEPQSVEAAVLAAQDHYADTLAFRESALISARESPFKQHKKVYQALLAMHEVCIAWRQSRRTKTPMGPFDQAFAKKGFIYKPKESMTSKGKWGEEYQMVYKGQPVSIEQHLALGKGGPDTCLRIHFYLDEQDERFVVAHVGRHKTNIRT